MGSFYTFDEGTNVRHPVSHCRFQVLEVVGQVAQMLRDRIYALESNACALGDLRGQLVGM